MHKWPNITFEQLRESINLARPFRPHKNILFRACGFDRWLEIDREFVLKVVDELQKKQFLVDAGIEEVSATDKLVMCMLITHAETILDLINYEVPITDEKSRT